MSEPGDDTSAAPIDLRLWGKRAGLEEPYPLLCHLLDTAAVTLALWDSWLRPGLRDMITQAIAPDDPQFVRRQVALVAGLHDVGKAQPVFQTQTLSRRAAELYPFAAELCAAGYATPDLSDLSLGLDRTLLSRHEVFTRHALGPEPEGDDLFPRTWHQAVGGAHHGRYRPLATRRVREHVLALCSGRWGEQQKAHVAGLLTALRLDEPLGPMTGKHASVAAILVQGLTCLADWVASDDETVREGQALLRRNDPAIDPADWLRLRADGASGHVIDTLGVHRPMDEPVRQVMREHAGHLSELQHDALSVGDGLWVVTVPTGDGKTEAAMLRHAGRADEGVIFALPTRATADAMMDRQLDMWAGTRTFAGLAHSYAALHKLYVPAQRSVLGDDGGDDSGGGLTPSRWLSGWSLKSLLAPVTVATCDQVLNAGLRRTWSPVRLLATANRHVILDEVHTYDQYQTRILVELLRWWSATDTRVTLLSATLPTWQRTMLTHAYSDGVTQAPDDGVAFPSHQVFTVAGAGPVHRPRSRSSYDLRFDVACSDDPVSAHVDWAREARVAAPGARIAVVVNQVKRCQDIARRLVDLGDHVVVLHSRMTNGHRLTVSEELRHLLGRPDGSGVEESGGVTVVATQVVESSLDVDFDLMSSDLAPAPALVQRAGRLHRFDDGRRAQRAPNAARVLHIVHSNGPPSMQRPYLPSEQRRTLEAIAGTPRLRVPGGIQALVDAAAFSWDDVIEEEKYAEQEASDIVIRTVAAERVLINMKVTLRRPTYDALHDMTNEPRDAVPRTRMIEEPTTQYLVIDPSGHIPDAWTDTITALSAGTGPEDLRLAVQAVVPVPDQRSTFAWLAAAADRACPLDLWNPAAAILRDMRPVRLEDSSQYDPVLGLLQRPPERREGDKK